MVVLEVACVFQYRVSFFKDILACLVRELASVPLAVRVVVR